MKSTSTVHHLHFTIQTLVIENDIHNSYFMEVNETLYANLF